MPLKQDTTCFMQNIMQLPHTNTTKHRQQRKNKEKSKQTPL